MQERKQFTKEFKEGAVRLVTEQGRTTSDAAQKSRHLAPDDVPVDEGRQA